MPLVEYLNFLLGLKILGIRQILIYFFFEGQKLPPFKELYHLLKNSDDYNSLSTILESVEKHEAYVGRPVKRGLFKSSFLQYL